MTGRRYIGPVTVQEICERYGVSKRTAYRHLKAGTLPDERRIRGRDGKTYPGSAASYAKRRRESAAPTSTDLAMARNAIRRLLRADRFYARDLPFAEQMQADLAELCRRWRQVGCG